MLRLSCFSLAFSALILTLSACAQPKYLNQAQAAIATEKSAQTLTCAATFKNQPYCVVFAWEKLPTESAPGSLILKLVRPNAADQSPLPVNLDASTNLQVELWMPSMGHGSTPITVTQLDTGTFRASEVFFIMRGLWELHFNLMNGDTKSDSASTNVSF